MKSKFVRAKTGGALDQELKQALSDGSNANMAFVLPSAIWYRKAIANFYHEIKMGVLEIITRPVGLGGVLYLSLGCDMVKSYSDVLKVEAKLGKDGRFIINLPTKS